MNDFYARAIKLRDQVLTDRRYLHQHAEVGCDLPVTVGYVARRLRDMGLAPRELCPGGVVADIKGHKPGKTYLLRADMDALPMEEQSGLPYRSRTAAAHTCGHDLHTAMALCAAQLLLEVQSELCGTVRLMFQPAEEQFQGAKDMIRAGVLEGVSACSGMHVMLDRPAPSVGYCGGSISSSCDGFKLTILGKSSHGAMPHLGLDPIGVGLHIVQAFQSLIARESPPAETAVLTVGQFTAGNAANILPDQAVLQGTLRTYDRELRARLRRRMQQICMAAGAMFNTQVRYEVLSEVPSCWSDPALTEELAGYLREIRGGEVVQAKPFTPSDDIAFISEQVPTVYFQLGAKVADHPHGHHDPKVLFDEEALPFGAAVHAQCAFRWLQEHAHEV